MGELNLEQRKARFQELEARTDEASVRERLMLLGLAPPRVTEEEYEVQVQIELRRAGNREAEAKLPPLVPMHQRTRTLASELEDEAELASASLAAGEVAPEPEYACDYCRSYADEPWPLRAVYIATGPADDKGYVPHITMPCPKCVPLSLRAARSGIDARFQDARLDHIAARAGNEELVALADELRIADARAIQEHRAPQPLESVVIASRYDRDTDSAYGTGKTYAACALLVRDIALGRPARFIAATDFLEEMKLRFDSEGEAAQAYANRIAAEPLLCIDDLGKEQGTEWAMAQMFRLLDTRYRRKLPTIITTNVDYMTLLARLGGAAVDRLHEYRWVAVGGRSMRGEEL